MALPGCIFLPSPGRDLVATPTARQLLASLASYHREDRPTKPTQSVSHWSLMQFTHRGCHCLTNLLRIVGLGNFDKTLAWNINDGHFCIQLLGVGDVLR